MQGMYTLQGKVCPMAQLIEIKRVEVGLTNLRARVRLSDNAPLMTSEDLVATTRIYYLMPHIVEHVCLGDANDTFKDVMGDTEIPHLLEHMVVELLSQSSESGEVTSGRTFPVEDDGRSYDIEVSCPDDVLVMGALSSAVWIANWAYGGGGEPEPDVEAIVAGLTNMVQHIGEVHAMTYQQQVEEQLQAELNAAYEERYRERQAQIEAREAEIAARRAEVRAEAERLAEEERQRREEEERARKEAEEAARRAQRPSWAVDLEAYDRAQKARRQAAAEDGAPTAATPVPEAEDSMESVPGPESTEAPEPARIEQEPEPEREPEPAPSAGEEPESQSPAASDASSQDESENFAAQLSSLFRSQPKVESVVPDETVAYTCPHDADVPEEEAPPQPVEPAPVADIPGPLADDDYEFPEPEEEPGEEDYDDEYDYPEPDEEPIQDPRPGPVRPEPSHSWEDDEHIPGSHRVR